MKKIFTYLAAMLLLVGSLTACETEGDSIGMEQGYNTLTVKLQFQANKDVAYYAILDGEPMPTLDAYGASVILPKSEESVSLKVYAEGSAIPELEETIEMEDGSMTVSLVQLPDSPISIASTGAEEADPATRNRIKIRFFYAQEDLGNSLKINVFGTDGGGDFSTWDEITSFTMEKGKFTDYIEFDMAKYYTSETAAAGEYHDPMYCFDVTDLDSGEKIMDYTTFGLRVDLTWDIYELPDENGARSGYKFMSSEMIIDREYGYGYFQFAFGTPWETAN